jgi:hypothetical protein
MRFEAIARGFSFKHLGRGGGGDTSFDSSRAAAGDESGGNNQQGRTHADPHLRWQ